MIRHSSFGSCIQQRYQSHMCYHRHNRRLHRPPRPLSISIAVKECLTAELALAPGIPWHPSLCGVTITILATGVAPAGVVSRVASLCPGASIAAEVFRTTRSYRPIRPCEAGYELSIKDEPSHVDKTWRLISLFCLQNPAPLN